MCHWPDGQSILARAPAKLNLHLEVLGRRDDGFHDLETVMVKLDLHDTLQFRTINTDANVDESSIQLDCRYSSPFFQSDVSSPPPIPVDESNLIVKAARLLQQTTGVTQGAHIELVKRIPVQAGLGGGSSDAAATLVALNQLWGLNYSTAELSQLAAQLGSDVPFFIDSSTAAVCRGRGEIITPVTIRGNFPVILAQPGSGLSTPTVFKKWSELSSQKACRSVEPLLEAMSSGKTNSVARLLFNALQIPAEQLNAQLKQLISLFQKFALPGTLMTGSGSCCFGICQSFRQATSISSLLRTAPFSRVCVTTLHHNRMHHGYYRSTYQANG
ncbi:4-diphosphocytidyl-2-C-methyl-D-erythritol kinase [Polystyrenella longa]|uniref:4-diphosphocytidyl-2-C-methyl-D-erythritol kinase n=1 Tax=Polystyrenella longa TaxID=2528007 RepID=A0A518CRK1_9PLAN|nr:4-(cytidine 5'-diphospho)-2-C-methyl-D-erythritol kinase [Polystyrenella longa]QDU81834.1 4-diphosphocytidyl-2-C-methyl-D-erythritol kinase [Polystyrenella longa]